MPGEALAAAVSRTGMVEDYDLKGVIGTGKFSTVYHAQTKPQREGEQAVDVALKKVQLFEIMDSKMRADCINEVRLLQSLDHPNIIRYLTSFIENNELIIVLEWAELGDLSKVIRATADAGAHFPEPALWSLFSQVVAAVAHMHSRRMMHRDIKPSNVLLAAGGSLRLGDLGLGRYFSSNTEQAQSLVGTPYYMSPECIRGLPYDTSSDIWSLGCLLYELATLKNPFFRDGLNYYTLGKLISSCTYEPLAPELPYGPEVGQLVATMITADPRARPTADRILEAARTALARVGGAG